MLFEEPVQQVGPTNVAVATENLNLGFVVREELYFPSLAGHGHLHHDRALTNRGQREVNVRLFQPTKKSRYVCKGNAGRISHQWSVAATLIAANRPRFMGSQPREPLAQAAPLFTGLAPCKTFRQ